MSKFSISPVEFLSQGTSCKGDLYLPVEVSKPPVVIMAHGFGAERKFCLPNFAEYFASNGLAVLLFDYRCFGDSDGTPRNYINPYRHLQDWQAALDYTRSLPKINNRKIGLWGSSFSGGHVMVIASKNPDIAALVSQVPHVDAITTISSLGLGYILKATFHGLIDLFCMLIGREPHYIKVYGSPSEFAALNTIDSEKGYQAIVAKNSNWINRCPARIMLILASYNPTRYASKVHCPALVMAAEKDSLIPISAVEKAANKMPKGKLVKYPYGHFEIYQGKDFQEAVKRQTEFLLTHLVISN
ncbi:MAG: alpha/beta fold hydrolase [Acidobacteria bacterium]|nr:alpha/beta fold hydrolase [Acidobacteriota bacterium]